jgi:thiol-disulfide isomerase/thioredoxin
MLTIKPRVRWIGPLVVSLAVLTTSACERKQEAARVEAAKVEAPKAEAPKAEVTEVAWKGYDEGLAEAKQSGKPVCLIFYTDWCPHCKNYLQVFHDPALVKLSQKFVMIHLNKDKEPTTSAKYAPDGDYIPRTFFLKPDGTLLDQVTEQRPQYKYFYDEHDPASVMRSMNAVLATSGPG